MPFSLRRSLPGKWGLCIMKSVCVGAAFLSLISLPTMADEYYVVRHLSTKHCTIVESPPTTIDLVPIKNGTVYFARKEAELVLASVPECASQTAHAASENARSTFPQTDVKSDRLTRHAAASRSKPKVKTAAKKSLGHGGAVAKPQLAVQHDPITSFFSLFR